MDTEWVHYNETTDRVEVPGKENVTIPGTTNVAAGTNLTIQIHTPVGELPAFFEYKTGIYPWYDEARNETVWEMTVKDAFAGANGTNFEIYIARQDAAGTINPGEFIDGIVDSPTVEAFEFTDKDSLGQVVIVDSLKTNFGGFIVIKNASGNEIGRTNNRLAAGELHKNIPVSLDVTLGKGTHYLTAEVFIDEGERYPSNAVRRATITVGESGSVPAFFQVSNLTPTSATVRAPGEDREVTATITNTGDLNGTKEVRFSLAGVIQGNETVSLNAGEETNVTFSANTSILDPGESAIYRISTDDSSQSGIVTVEGGTETEGETVSEGQPGFGIGLAIVAIVIVGFFAQRRISNYG